jgi:hypothetical protein
VPVVPESGLVGDRADQGSALLVAPLGACTAFSWISELTADQDVPVP